MNIIYIENTDPFENFVGGIPTYIRNAAKYMKKHKVRVCFVGSLLSKKSEDNVKVLFDDFKSLSDVKIGHVRFLLKLISKKKEIKITKETIIHSQRLILCLPFILSFKKYKIICTSHGIEKQTVQGRRGGFQGFIYELIERIVVPNLCKLTVVDPRAEKYYKEKYPSMKEKVVRIPIGIEVERFYPLAKEDSINTYNIDLHSKNILFLGRIDYQKNLKLLLDAYKIVKNKFDQASLIIAGDGKDREYYENYCISNNILGVRFIGSVPPEDLIHLLNLCQVLALSSHFEGSPTVVKEAIACNLPVVSTYTGDVAEVIDGLHRCFIAQSHPDDLSRCIIESINSNGLINYKDRVKEYHNENLFKKLYDVYEAVD